MCCVVLCCVLCVVLGKVSVDEGSLHCICVCVCVLCVCLAEEEKVSVGWRGRSICVTVLCCVVLCCVCVIHSLTVCVVVV